MIYAITFYNIYFLLVKLMKKEQKYDEWSHGLGFTLLLVKE